MKLPSDWIRAITIYYTVENRSLKKFRFPIRGSSPQEIVNFLLTECGEYLWGSEMKELQNLKIPSVTAK